MPQYTTCLSCACGAKYERGEVKLPIRDVGVQECHHCGATIERWQGKVVPIFRLLSVPKSNKADAA